MGDREPLVFNPIPDNEQFYATGLRIIAEDADGKVVETAMPLTIHRPLEVRLLSKESELAERYAPEPVSGCMKGSISTRVRYNETRSQSRQRTVGMTVSTDWSQATGASSNQNWQEGIKEGVSVSQSLRGSTTERESSREAFGLDYTNSEANRMNMGRRMENPGAGIAVRERATRSINAKRTDSMETAQRVRPWARLARAQFRGLQKCRDVRQQRLV